jgi:hypothetical protein
MAMAVSLANDPCEHCVFFSFFKIIIQYSIEGFILTSTSTFHIEYMQLQQHKMWVDDFDMYIFVLSSQ